MKQFFPFGRGDRGSRQRLVVEFEKWGAVLVVHDVKVRVLQTEAPDRTVFAVGTSVLFGERRVFVYTQFREAFKALVQAGKNFHKVRATNKLWQKKRRVYGGVGKGGF